MPDELHEPDVAVYVGQQDDQNGDIQQQRQACSIEQDDNDDDNIYTEDTGGLSSLLYTFIELQWKL